MSDAAVNVPAGGAAGHRRWYRSLYWRIAVGLFAFLALMLAAEAALLLWVSDRMAGSMPASSPQRLAVLVASDVGAALARDASLDLDAYLKGEYGDVLQTFFVILRDGRMAANHDDVPNDRPPPALRVRAAVAQVVVGGMPVGRVAVLGGRPGFTRVVRQFGPTMALVAGGVLIVGTSLIAFVVFGPTRRRLSEVQA